MQRQLILSPGQMLALLTESRRGLPFETCGILGGQDSTVMQVFPIGNISERPQDSFYMEPEGLFRTLVVLDDHGWDVLGTYHSHPPGSRTDPSPRDRLSASYPGSLQVIIVPGRNEDLGIIRAFDLAMGRPVEVPIVVAESLTPLRTTKRNLRGLNYQSKE